jgi:hypothetical protein
MKQGNLSINAEGNQSCWCWETFLRSDNCLFAHRLQRSKHRLLVADTVLSSKRFDERLPLAILQHGHAGPKVVLNFAVQVAVYGCGNGFIDGGRSVAEHWPQATAMRGQPSPGITVMRVTSLVAASAALPCSFAASAPPPSPTAQSLHSLYYPCPRNNPHPPGENCSNAISTTTAPAAPYPLARGGASASARLAAGAKAL